MKKNFLIMLLTVFCVSFAFAQDDNTVRGFVPGAGTGASNDHQTYAVVGQVFGALEAEIYEVAEGLAQMQIVADTLEPIILTCGDAINVYPFNTIYTAEKIQELIPIDSPLDTFLTVQFPNRAIYNYDSVYVLHVLGCNCKVRDNDGNQYDVMLVNDICWTKPNMRPSTTCDGNTIDKKEYSTDVTPELDYGLFGYLYTWAEATQNEGCDSVYIQGICPCGWHIPTAEEMSYWLSFSASALRDNNPDNWVAGVSTNESEFSAQPAGIFNSSANRFEGYTTEADFWFVGENCTPTVMQILYYCNVPMTFPRNPNDALSVRCAKDLNYDHALATGQLNNESYVPASAENNVNNGRPTNGNPTNGNPTNGNPTNGNPYRGGPID